MAYGYGRRHKKAFKCYGIKKAKRVFRSVSLPKKSCPVVRDIDGYVTVDREKCTITLKDAIHKARRLQDIRKLKKSLKP